MADELVMAVYEATGAFPKYELYGLVSQMRRAAYSVPANVVEGCARGSQRDFVRFLRQAMGSLRELGYFIDLSQKLTFLDRTEGRQMHDKYETCARKLAALINSLS